jgi:hypothetical protein
VPEPSACDGKTMTSAASVQGTLAQQWLARLSFVLAGLAIGILVVFAELKSLAMFAVGLTAVVVSVAAAYFFLSRRGIVRWLSFGVFVLVPIAVIVIFAVGGVLWVAIVSAGVWLLAGRDREPGAGRGPAGLAHARVSGAYAEIVQSPAYRGDKVGTTLDLLPDLLQGHRGARMAARVEGTQIEAPQALRVANNPYGTEDIVGLGRRARLDGGVEPPY